MVAIMIMVTIMIVIVTMIEGAGNENAPEFNIE